MRAVLLARAFREYDADHNGILDNDEFFVFLVDVGDTADLKFSRQESDAIHGFLVR